MKLYICPKCGYEEVLYDKAFGLCPECGFDFSEYKSGIELFELPAEEIDALKDTVSPEFIPLTDGQQYLNPAWARSVPFRNAPHFFDSDHITLHYSLAQSERITASNFTKVLCGSLDPTNYAADLLDEDGSVYHATVRGCTCEDFRSRHLPCKHMYRVMYDFDFCKIMEHREHFHLCPVCKEYVFEETFSECEICGWGHDGIQDEYPDLGGCYDFVNLYNAREALSLGITVIDIYSKDEILDGTYPKKFDETQMNFLRKLWRRHFKQYR